MADEKFVPEFITDAPASTAIVTTRHEAKALARSLFGDSPPNRCRYICIACGWDKTLEFDEMEMAALGHDLAEYSGPCGQCNCQTLVQHDSVLAGTNIAEAAQANFTKQIDDASNIVLDKVEKRVQNFMMGGATIKSDTGPATPSARENFPDANSIPDKK